MSLGQSTQWGCGYAAMRMSREPCAWSLAAVTVAYLFPRLWPSDAISPSFEHHHHAAQGVTPTARPLNGLCLASPAMYTSGSRREARLPALVYGRGANRKLKHLTPCIVVFR